MTIPRSCWSHRPIPLGPVPSSTSEWPTSEPSTRSGAPAGPSSSPHPKSTAGRSAATCATPTGTLSRSARRPADRSKRGCGLELRRRGRRRRWLGGGRLLVDPEFVDVQPRDLQVLDLEAADRRSSDHQPANRQGADGSGADSRCPGRGRADADRCQKHRRRLLAAATELHCTVGASSTVHVIVLLLVRLGVIERANDNAQPADRIVSRGRAGERGTPPRASVSDSRQPTEREAEAAAIGGLATWSGGVSIRIPSSRSNRRTWPAHSLPASLAWRALCLLADAPILQGGTPPGRGQWAQLLSERVGDCRTGSLLPLGCR